MAAVNNRANIRSLKGGRNTPMREVPKGTVMKVSADMTFIICLLFLLAFGLIMIFSASSYKAYSSEGDYSYYFYHQLWVTLLGIVMMVVFSFVPYKLYFNRIIIISMTVVALILVALVRTSLGMELNGARRWLNFMGISFQPAEAVKIVVIILTARIICTLHQETMDGMAGAVRVVLPGLLLGAFLGKCTNNMSSAIIICAIPALMYALASRNNSLIFIGGLFVLLAFAGYVFLIYKGIIPTDAGFRNQRIAVWLNPESDTQEIGYQTMQSLYCIGSGGIFGKGLGGSIQKVTSLPEAQNDMIFSIICEELGVFGAVCVMIMFGVLIYRCFSVARRSADMFGGFLAIGVASHIAVQVVLNIAVVTNTIPNTGVTLPFVSYGGSSIVLTLIEMGILVNVSKKVVAE